MASTTEFLKAKILKRIDEATPQLSDGTISQYNIEDFIEDAAIQVLYTAPLCIVPVTDFRNAIITHNVDGSGSVTLPSGFMRLVEFRLVGWERPVNATITVNSPLYQRQFNKVLRGGPAKPVAAIVQNRLEYYSLPAAVVDAEIASAKCVVKTAAKDLPEQLEDPLCWLTASIILGVMNEPMASETARKRYNELMLGLYGDDTANH